MLQNAYLLAKIGADTAENERNFAENLPKIGNYPTGPAPTCGTGAPPGSGPVGFLPIFGKFSAKLRSFSAVSAPIFASKYAFCSIFQNLPDYLAEIFEIWQYFANFATFAKFLLNFHKNC